MVTKHCKVYGDLFNFFQHNFFSIEKLFSFPGEGFSLWDKKKEFCCCCWKNPEGKCSAVLTVRPLNKKCPYLGINITFILA